MYKKRVSLKDVALKAGVSITLASYILNGRHIGRINKETSEKVRKIAEELNYRPNKIAQSLRSSKTHTLALIVSDIANPLISKLVRMIEDESHKCGYVVMVGSSDDNIDKLKQLIDVFLNHQVDGFIIAPVEGSQPVIRELLKMRIPVVLINRYLKEIEAPVITTNNYGVSYMAIEYLIQKGRKNIGILACKSDLSHSNERIEGCKEGLQKRGLHIADQNIKYLDETLIQKEIDQVLDEMLRNNSVDALFFTTHKLAVAALRKLIKMKIRIPEDLALLSFDESEAFDVFKVPITHIRQPMYEISQGAVETLINIIQDKNFKPKHRIYNSKLIIKKST